MQKTPSRNISPMMAQWYECKKKAKDALLLFRLGDFYEAFYEDAVLLSKELNLALTKRQEAPMSGFPHHASENYIKKLLEKGFLIAVAEQIEGPERVKGLVKREIVRTISPGTVLNASLLADKENNFFACIARNGAIFALSLLDLSTGEFRVLEFESIGELQDEVFRRAPSEILISQREHEKLGSALEELRAQCNFRISIEENGAFDLGSCRRFLLSHFQVHSLDSFGFDEGGAAIHAAGALLAHVRDALSFSIAHIKAIQLDHLRTYMAIDRSTQRNLELTEPLNAKGEAFTLIKLLDRTQTPMGARLLKVWLMRPLLSIEGICARHDAVEELLCASKALRDLREELKQIRDLERLIMRISTGYSTPRDLTGLRFSLEVIPQVVASIRPLSSPLLREIGRNLPDLTPVAQRIARALVDDPPNRLGEGMVIRTGFHRELDRLRSLKGSNQKWIAEYQAELQRETGIKTLKIIYSKAFGYCIEVSRNRAQAVPASFERRQTLVNGERFISPELKEREEQILTADEEILRVEQEVYADLRREISAFIDPIKESARAIAELDCLLALAMCARANRYVRPTISLENRIEIESGRHPIIETTLLEEEFIPNDIDLDEKARLLLITGPNMAGKSTYIRQVALLTIMAQMGSFVPAKSAHIGIVDRVFSRIGASDDLARGHSTFMVEMTETANILHNATSRSLVVLDEIGRGTSTYDGISIAWSVAEYLLHLGGGGAKTLFATHYWELTALAQRFPSVKNCTVAVREEGGGILFLRKIVEGSADRSYGIHVARLAGLPRVVIDRAREVLRDLEKSTPGHEVLDRLERK